MDFLTSPLGDYRTYILSYSYNNHQLDAFGVYSDSNGLAPSAERMQ